MSKQNLDSLKSQLANTSKRLPYRQPEVYSLGSLEQVQSYYEGSYYDGPNSWYYYDG
jgi:hypothetical protein